MAAKPKNDADVARAAPLELKIERVFKAPRDLVFAAWSKPEHLNKWSAPSGFSIPEAAMDFRAGGRWYCHMRSPDGADHKVQGAYQEIVPGHRIVMTHAWLDADGEPGPQTIVTVEFSDAPEGTRMSFVQRGFSSKASRDGHEGGWSQCFDQLADLLAGLQR